jgi:hypothetical protein
MQLPPIAHGHTVSGRGQDPLPASPGGGISAGAAKPPLSCSQMSSPVTGSARRPAHCSERSITYRTDRLVRGASSSTRTLGPVKGRCPRRNLIAGPRAMVLSNRRSLIAERPPVIAGENRSSRGIGSASRGCPDRRETRSAHAAGSRSAPRPQRRDTASRRHPSYRSAA